MKPRQLLLLHFFVVTLLFFATGSYRNWPYKIESDGKYYYQYLVSVWFDGDIDFANNYRVDRLPFMRTEIDHYQFREQLTVTGRPINMFTTGPALLWSPFFLVVYGVASGLNWVGLASLSLEGWSQFFQYGVMYSAVIYSTITIALIYKLLRQFFEQTVSLITVFLLFWATNWVYYAVFEVSMSHTYDLFTLVAFVWLYLKALDSRKPLLFLGAGFLAGLHVLIRTQNLLSVAILVTYYVVWSTINRPGQHRHLKITLKNHLIFAVIFLLTLLPLAINNLYLYGQLLALPQGDGFLKLSQPEIYGVLLSGRNGLFSHHPVLLLGAAGLLVALVRFKAKAMPLLRMVLPLLIVFVAQVYINAAAADWWGGHAFGQRRLMAGLLLFGFGLAFCQQYLYRWRTEMRPIFLGVALIFALLNGYVMAIHLFMWSYDEPHNIIHWMFIEAPNIALQVLAILLQEIL